MEIKIPNTMELAEPTPYRPQSRQRLSETADILMEGIMSGNADYRDVIMFLKDEFGEDYTPQQFMDELDKSYGYDQRLLNELTFDIKDWIMAGGDVLRGNKRDDEGFVDAFKRNWTERQAAQTLYEMGSGLHGRIDPGSLVASLPAGLGMAKVGLKGMQAGANMAAQGGKIQKAMQSPIGQGAAIGGTEAGLRTLTDRLPQDIDEPGRFLQHVLWYGGMGSMMGGAIPFATGALAKLVNFMKGMTDKGAVERTEEVAYDIFKEYGDDGTQAMHRTLEMREKFPKSKVNIGDMSLAGRDMLEAGSQAFNAGRATLVDELEDRQAGQLERLLEYLDEALGNDANLITAASEFSEQASKQAGPLYKEIEDIVVDDFKVLGFMKKPIFQQAYELARRSQSFRQANGLSHINMPGGFQKNEAGEMMFLEPEEYTIGMLDLVKQHLDDMVFSNKRLGQGGFTKEMTIAPGDIPAVQNLRYSFVDAMDNSLEDYKKAREVFAGNMEIAEAFEKGSKFFKGKRDSVQTDFNALKTEGAKQAYRIGARNSIQNALGNLPETTDVAKKLRTYNAMDKFKIVFPEGKYEEAALYFDLESMTSKTKNAILANSRTAKLQAFQERFGENPTDRDLLNFIYTGVTNPLEAAKRATDLVQSASPKVRDRIVTLLLDDDAMMGLTKRVEGRKKFKQKAFNYSQLGGLSTIPGLLGQNPMN